MQVDEIDQLRSNKWGVNIFSREEMFHLLRAINAGMPAHIESGSDEQLEHFVGVLNLLRLYRLHESILTAILNQLDSKIMGIDAAGDLLFAIEEP